MIFLGINNLKAKFRNTIFEEVYFGKEIDDRNLEKSNSFGSCSFEYTDFSNCHFKNEVYFKNNEFKQVFFRNSNLTIMSISIILFLRITPILTSANLKKLLVFME
ncbi:hypothetical protein FLW88_000910 [Campylobacter coli]